MRVLFYTILTSLGLLLSLIIIAPSFFDPNSYKTKLYQLVESQTGYKIDLKGPLELSFFPKINMKAENITKIQIKWRLIF